MAAYGCMPGSHALPPNTRANSGEATSASPTPSRAAISAECASSTGAATGVGLTADQSAPVTSRMPGPWMGSPGNSRTNALSNRKSMPH